MYKGIERSTGETVAIKHVSPSPSSRVDMVFLETDAIGDRLTSNRTTMTSKISKQRSLC